MKFKNLRESIYKLSIDEIPQVNSGNFLALDMKQGLYCGSSLKLVEVEVLNLGPVHYEEGQISLGIHTHK